MGKLSHGRLRRITAEFRGDEAVELDIIEVSLRIEEVARTRLEVDSLMVRLAIQALKRTITEFCGKTGVRYPNYRSLVEFLDDHCHEADSREPSNVVSLPG